MLATAADTKRKRDEFEEHMESLANKARDVKSISTQFKTYDSKSQFQVPFNQVPSFLVRAVSAESGESFNVRFRAAAGLVL